MLKLLTQAQRECADQVEVVISLTRNDVLQLLASRVEKAVSLDELAKTSTREVYLSRRLLQLFRLHGIKIRWCGSDMKYRASGFRELPRHPCSFPSLLPWPAKMGRKVILLCKASVTR